MRGRSGGFAATIWFPVPEVDSLAELNALVESWDAADDARRVGARPRTVGEMFALEAPLLRPLPAEPQAPRARRRRRHHPTPAPHRATTDATEVTSLTQRRLAHLPTDTRPLPWVAIDDHLLPSRRIPREGTSP